MPRHEFLYLIYGKPTPFLEGRYSILSAIAASPDDPPQITVITDRPEAFTGFPVNTVLLDPALHAAWKGPHNFIHRAKICAMQSRIAHCDKLALIDADTIFLHPAQRLFDRVQPGRSLLHCDEGGVFICPDHALIGNALRTRFSDGHLPSLDGPPLAFPLRNDGPHMWNSGVVALDAADHHLLPQILHACDLLYPLTHAHTAEQFGFSLLLVAKTSVEPASDFIEHYWPIKPYPSRPEWKNQRVMYHEQAEHFFAAHPHANFAELLHAFQRRPARLFRITPRIRFMTAIHRRVERLPRPLQPLLHRLGF